MCKWCVSLLLTSAELRAKNDYKSCSLPSFDDDDDDDDAQDDNVVSDYDISDDDDVTTRNINYVIGNVLQPQDSDDADAVIVHCVGKDVQDAAEILSLSVLSICIHFMLLLPLCGSRWLSW